MKGPLGHLSPWSTSSSTQHRNRRPQTPRKQTTPKFPPSSSAETQPRPVEAAGDTAPTSTEQRRSGAVSYCPLLPVAVVLVRRGEMSVRIKAVVDKFVRELKEALDADIQDRIMKEREMQSYIAEREREVAEREAAWKAELSRREAEIARQEARLKIERENLEKEKSVLMGTASNQDSQDGALEITVGGEKYRCLRFTKAKK
ncbi:hypothetical protein PAHAL_6G262100 [Panicum hallii]|uniref:Uncharacterized protein n=1 Tax=Panicum hallii TaxID=206008 RepID=A0A2S3I401_9POAL|nr:uncharacterized protein LOC112897379 [Panicum hallii]PAN36225.1 hypothetical protein PAHAL_6G262100 [Panicum hallii]